MENLVLEARDLSGYCAVSNVTLDAAPVRFFSSVAVDALLALVLVEIEHESRFVNARQISARIW